VEKLGGGTLEGDLKVDQTPRRLVMPFPKDQTVKVGLKGTGPMKRGSGEAMPT